MITDLLRTLIICSLLGITTNIFATNLNAFKIHTIDNKDSINFDLGAAIVTNNIVEIPVFIKTDDQIFALDFEMTFNAEKLEYISVVDHTGYIQYNAFQNPNDKKLRFTSNHTSPYNTSQKIISVRFKLTAMCINETDFFKINNFLNGDICSLKMAPKTICGTSSTDEFNSFFNSLPNPINNDINVVMPGESSVSICNIQGVPVLEFFNRTDAENTILLPVSSLVNGVYILCIRTNNKVHSKKILVQNY